MTMEVTVELVSKNQQWILNKSEIKIGREAQCDVRLSGDEFAMVSRLHASLRVEDGNCFLEDANSPNGTFLNGQRVQRAKLVPGDKVRLGSDGPELNVRFIPEAAPAVIPATIAGAEGQFRHGARPMPAKEPSAATAAPAKPEDADNAAFVMLERKLNGMRKLIAAALAITIIEGIIVVYQGYTITRTHDTVLQMRRQAADAVAQFAPALDQKIADFQKRADDMQAAVGGFDRKIKQAEDEFVQRMQKEVPATMDRYIQSKLDELRGSGRRSSR